MRSPACALALALALGTTAVCAQTPAVEAQQRFLEGRRFYEAGQYPAARALFETSLARFDSPNTRLYLARTLALEGRLVDAVLAYDRALAAASVVAQQDPRYVPTREAAAVESQRLEPRVARVTLVIPERPAGLRITVAGRAVEPTATVVSVPVEPGTVVVTADAADGASFRSTLNTVPGSRESVTLALTPAATTARVEPAYVPPPPPPVRAPGVRVARPAIAPVAHRARSSRPWLGVGIAVLGVGAAGLATAAVLELVAASQYDSLATMCTGGCLGDPGSAIMAGERSETGRNVALGVGIGLVALGAGFVMAGAFGGHAAPARAAVRPHARGLEVVF